MKSFSERWDLLPPQEHNLAPWRRLGTPPLAKEPEGGRTKSRRKPDIKSNSALEEVVREFALRKDRSAANTGDESQGIREQDGNIQLVSTQCDERIILPRRMMALSGKFCQMMEVERFDGVITITDGKEAMKLLGAWMSRDLKFEISIGTSRYH